MTEQQQNNEKVSFLETHKAKKNGYHAFHAYRDLSIGPDEVLRSPRRAQ
jgi:hypothetical protein